MHTYARNASFSENSANVPPCGMIPFKSNTESPF